MQIILFDMNEQVCEGWEREFSSHSEDVMVYNGKLEEIPACDALVAAGNSFGIMDGGLDAAMATQFPAVQSNVSDAIATDFMGEIPVGQAVIVPIELELDDGEFNWLVYTPTMRYPRPIPAEQVYDATRAALLAVRTFNQKTIMDSISNMTDEEINEGAEPTIDPKMMIESIAIPGMGTATGQVGAFKAARMMRLAYESIYLRGKDGSAGYDDWSEVEAHLKKIYGNT